MSDDYYTDKPIKGSGSGGQFNPQSPKAIEAIIWIYTRRPGRRIKREDVPVSHLVADGALHTAEQMNLVSAEPRTRTQVGWSY